MHSIINKLYIKQWSIGAGKYNHKKLLTSNIIDTKINWFVPENSHVLVADPFLIKNSIDNNYHIFYEYFDAFKNYGIIKSVVLDQNLHFNPDEKTTLNTGSHLSYPYIHHCDEGNFLIPESSKSNELICYELDEYRGLTGNQNKIMEGIQLLDCTFLFHNQKYWIFATKRGDKSNADLYIYHSSNWKGPYIPHILNPVKSSLFGTRPAGGFFIFNNDLFRPAQNCEVHYGQSIIINKIIKLNECEFEEIAVNEIFPHNDHFCQDGLHTINICDDIIVIDGLRKIFQPYKKLKSFILKAYKH